MSLYINVLLLLLFSIFWSRGLLPAILVSVLSVIVDRVSIGLDNTQLSVTCESELYRNATGCTCMCLLSTSLTALIRFFFRGAGTQCKRHCWSST